jgi:hypothetical protein
VSLVKHIVEHSELGYPDSSKVGGPLSILDEGVLIQSKATGINFIGSEVLASVGVGGKVDVTFTAKGNIDGGRPDSIYGGTTSVDGGDPSSF